VFSCGQMVLDLVFENRKSVFLSSMGRPSIHDQGSGDFACLGLLFLDNNVVCSFETRYEMSMSYQKSVVLFLGLVRMMRTCPFYF